MFRSGLHGGYLVDSGFFAQCYDLMALAENFDRKGFLFVAVITFHVMVSKCCALLLLMYIPMAVVIDNRPSIAPLFSSYVSD